MTNTEVITRAVEIATKSSGVPFIMQEADRKIFLDLCWDYGRVRILKT